MRKDKWKNILISFPIAVLLALMPFTADLRIYLNDVYPEIESKAYAEEITGINSQFIEDMAYAAGLGGGDFIATVIGSVTAGTGYKFVKATDNINFGASTSVNLDSLIDAADYPAWESLSSSEQSQWSSKDEYNSAKFNSLMDAFGMSQDYEDYKNWEPTIGNSGSFEFSTEAKKTLEQIGRIGNNWKNGLANTFGEITGLFNKDDVDSWMPAVSGDKIYDATGDENWPSVLPSQVTVAEGNYFQQGNQKFAFNSMVYAISFKNRQYFFKSYNFGGNSGSSPSVPTSNNATSATVNNEPVYYRYWQVNNQTNSGNIPIYNVSMTDSEYRYVMYSILYGQLKTDERETIEGYPEGGSDTISNQLQIVFPTGGTKEDTPWEDFISEQQKTNDAINEMNGILQKLAFDADNCLKVYDHHMYELVQQFQFYNNGILKVHDLEVFNKLSDLNTSVLQIKTLLENWFANDTASDVIGEFNYGIIEDKVPDLVETLESLAPFGALALISDMVAILTTVNPIQEPTLSFPFNFGLADQHWQVQIDLSWMDPLRPFINFSLITMLIIGLLYVSWRVVEMEAASG